MLQGKTVTKRSSSEAPAVSAERPQHDVNERKPRPSLEGKALAEQQTLSAAITPAIEAMLQVRSVCNILRAALRHIMPGSAC